MRSAGDDSGRIEKSLFIAYAKRPGAWMRDPSTLLTRRVLFIAYATRPGVWMRDPSTLLTRRVLFCCRPMRYAPMKRADFGQ